MRAAVICAGVLLFIAVAVALLLRYAGRMAKERAREGRRLNRGKEKT